MENLPQEILSAWKQITSKMLAAESSVQGSSVKQTWVWKTEGKPGHSGSFHHSLLLLVWSGIPQWRSCCSLSDRLRHKSQMEKSRHMSKLEVLSEVS